MPKWIRMSIRAMCGEVIQFENWKELPKKMKAHAKECGIIKSKQFYNDCDLYALSSYPHWLEYKSIILKNDLKQKDWRFDYKK